MNEDVIAAWLKRLGTPKKRFAKHPQIDVLLSLLKFRIEYDDMNRYCHRKFFRIWKSVDLGNEKFGKKRLKQLKSIQDKVERERKRSS